MTFTRSFYLTLGVLSLWSATPRSASANERHFTYIYESAVLPPGAREIEIWTTPRIGRDDYYARFDQRMEFEVGLTDRLMTALYLNFNSITAETAPGVLASEFEFAGVSSEWKYKLTDPVADAVGFGLYGEVTAAPHEYELEAKLLFDKKVGDLLLAANLIGELELEFEGEMAAGEVEAERKIVVEPVMGLTYFFTPRFSAGLELRNHNTIAQGELVHSTLFAGPVCAYATDSWWVAATILPQLPALHEQNGNTFELTDNERFTARVLLSFHL